MSRGEMSRDEMGIVRFRRFDTVVQLADEAARMIIDGIQEARIAGRRYLLGCPGGRTPKPIFEALAKHCAQRDIDCSHVIIAMMDDYLEPGADPLRTIDADAPHSCLRFAEVEIRGLVNAGLSDAHRIPAAAVWFPDPRDPSEYDRRLADAGGVDLFLVASGASDGHVAFCGPGSPLDGVSSIVELAESTRQDNTVTFPNLGSTDEVPAYGVTVGLGTIRRLSRSVLLVIHGADKRKALERVRGAAGHEPDWPATFVHTCDRAEVWHDELADVGAVGDEST